MDFPTTHWTLLAQATLNGDTAANKALESFCLRYREPVVKLLRWKGILESRVEDMTHDFFLDLLRHSALKKADPQQGRFRSFLCGALSNFLSNDIRRNQSLKRGGGVVILHLDEMQHDQPGDGAIDQDEFSAQFDKAWVMTVIETTISKLKSSYEASGRSDRFEVLKDFLPGGSASMSGEEAAAAMGLGHATARSEISRMRERFRELLRAEIAMTVPHPEDVDDELRYLFQVLKKS